MPRLFITKEPMTAQSFHCPACGAPLLPKGTASIISCPHCHTSVIVPEELRQEAEIARWTTVLYDNFISRDNNWLVRNETSEYFAPLEQKIEDGRYRWQATVNRASSISTSWIGGYRVSDFHLSVNCKHIMGSKAGSSWGVILRIQDNHNYYWFRMTESLFFAVSVVRDREWLNLVEWTRTDTIKPNGVNQLEVIGNGAHLVFLINGQIVSELNDHHFSQGLAGLAIEGYTVGEKTTFDFLDFTLREQK